MFSHGLVTLISAAMALSTPSYQHLTVVMKFGQMSSAFRPISCTFGQAKHVWPWLGYPYFGGHGTEHIIISASNCCDEKERGNVWMELELELLQIIV